MFFEQDSKTSLNVFRRGLNLSLRYNSRIFFFFFVRVNVEIQFVTTEFHTYFSKILKSHRALGCHDIGYQQLPLNYLTLVGSLSFSWCPTYIFWNVLPELGFIWRGRRHLQSKKFTYKTELVRKCSRRTKNHTKTTRNSSFEKSQAHILY